MDGKSLSGKEINDVMDSTERWKRVFPDDWRHPTIYAFTKDDGSRLAWEQQQIPPVTLDWLNEHGYCCEGSYFINIESGYTVSPYEFYGRPLKMKSDNIWMKPESVIQSDILNDMSSNEEDAIITANNELANFGDELHKFYRRKENRHRLQLPELVENLSKSRRIFAMAEIEDEDSMGLGCWRRVEIFCVKKVWFCRSNDAEA
ncbi:hypothetical protein AB6A40_003755 [Gnathostoma spinigerum]|uniref:Uncharacterized protein n=1 Tax=Gnathostoma spinigerum TaxID=75299 RepID=A0ABD6EBL5_9BILA